MASKFSARSILMIGGSGFLGKHLIQDIVERGINPECIHMLDIKSQDNGCPGLSYHRSDITIPKQVEEVFQIVKPSIVFHLASPYPFETDHTILEQINIIGTRNLIESAQAVDSVSAFIYTSSSSVIHDHWNPLRDADESYPMLFSPEQPNYYSHTKAVAERIVLSANRKVSHVLTASIRPASMYGEGDTIQIPNLVKNARSGRARLQIGSGNNKFDNTYIKNLTHAQILAAEALLGAANAEPLPLSMRIEGEAFLVTDDDLYTFPAYTRLVAKCAGHPVKPEDIRVIPLWFMLCLVYVAEWLYWIITFGKEMAFSARVVRMLAQERTFNIDKIKTRLGYRPRFMTAEGTKRAVDWFLDHENTEMTQKKVQ